jgi:DNA-binding NarL/FixJ family response regulator
VPGVQPIRIVLADDHAVVRSGLRLLLDGEEGLEVVAEAGEMDTAQRTVCAHRPDVLVLDLNMPGPESLPASASARSNPTALTSSRRRAAVPAPSSSATRSTTR